MEQRQRRVEVYQLIVSPVDDVATYSTLIHQSFDKVADKAELQHQIGTKTHALFELGRSGDGLTIRFVSFSHGSRPDVIDTTSLAIKPSPLASHQTPVNYTHVVTGCLRGEYILVLEKAQNGISALSIGTYLGWLINNNLDSTDTTAEGPRAKAKYRVEMRPKGFEDFVKRVYSLDRITKLTAHFVRHENPGLDKNLGFLVELGEQSRAAGVDVSMSAERAQGLSSDTGWLKWVIDRLESGNIDDAKVRGWLGGAEDTFSARKQRKIFSVPIAVDKSGQVAPNDAFLKLSEIRDVFR